MTSQLCTLCEKPIADYSIEFNKVVIDEAHTVNICADCMEKIGTQQRAAHAKLFPTKTAQRLLHTRLPKGAQQSHSSVKGHGKRPMRRY